MKQSRITSAVATVVFEPGTKFLRPNPLVPTSALSTMSGSPPVVIVTGPTASGKTAIGIRLARRFDGEILNADSMQVYRYLDIGTAKPTLAERAEVPHHLESQRQRMMKVEGVNGGGSK